METFSVPQMASAWSTYHQTTQSAQRSPHWQLPQRRLQYWSRPGVQLHRTKKPGHPGINTASTSDSASAQIPQQGTGSPQGPLGSGCHLQVDLLREAIHSSAMSALGGMDRPSHSWFNASLPIMEPLIEVKQQAHLKYKKNPCEKIADSTPRCTQFNSEPARRCANDYWFKLCNEIQLTTQSWAISEVCKTASRKLWVHYRPQRTNGQMGGTLLWALSCVRQLLITLPSTESPFSQSWTNLMLSRLFKSLY